MDLSGLHLAGARLNGADLRTADLRGTNLEGADLKGADLRDSGLEDANLRGAGLRSADVRGADLRSAGLKHADKGRAEAEMLAPRSRERTQDASPRRAEPRGLSDAEPAAYGRYVGPRRGRSRSICLRQELGEKDAKFLRAVWAEGVVDVALHALQGFTHCRHAGAAEVGEL